MPYTLDYRDPTTITPGGSNWQKTQGEGMYGSFWPTAARTAGGLHVTVGASTTLQAKYHLHMGGRYDVTVNLDQATGAVTNSLVPNGDGAMNPIPWAVADFALRVTPCLFRSRAVGAAVTAAAITFVRQTPVATPVAAVAPAVAATAPVATAASAPVVSVWGKPRPF